MCSDKRLKHNKWLNGLHKEATISLWDVNNIYRENRKLAQDWKQQKYG